MAYEVTATRKRPQLFDGLVGQEFVVSTIKNSIEQGRIAHAYLFSGPRGVGKTSSARILAKALNCEHGPTAYPCGVCANCREIAQGNATDIIEIDGASNTSVNDVRVIKDEILFPPQSCRYKIYIIDEVHMLSTSAFNALLKTIEEPPEYVVFIFATTETQKVPATIRSRCQQFHFRLIPLEIIKKVLSETASEMGIEAEDDALFWMAKESTGSLRDAYTLFDQVISFSEGSVTMEKIQRKLGLAGIDRLSDIVEKLHTKQTAKAMEALHRLLDSGVSVEQSIKDFAEYFRTLLLIKQGIGSESILGLQPSRIPRDILEAYNDEQLEAAIELFLHLYRDIRFSMNPRFELELAVNRLANLSDMVSSVTLVRQIQAMKDDLLHGEIRVTRTVEDKTLQTASKDKQEVLFSTPEPIRQAIKHESAQPVAPIPGEQTVQAPVFQQKRTISKEMLPELIQEMAAERDPAGIVLSQVTDITQSEKTLTFVFSSNYALETAKQNEEKLRTLVRRHTGYDGPVVFTKAETKQEGETGPHRNADETVNTIATLFRGEII